MIPSFVAACADLQTVIDAMLDADLGALPDSVMCERVVALRRQIDQLESVFSGAVALVHERGAASAAGYITTAAFLRHAIHITHAAARTRVDVAMTLPDRPAVAAAFASGAISHPHVALVTEALQSLPRELATDAEPVLLKAAHQLDTGQLRQVIRRLRHVADPDGQAGVDARHAEDRWLDLSPTFAGMVAINGLLNPETGAVLRTAIDALTPPGTDDTRTQSTRRADALHELARRALDAGALPDTGGERPHLNITVDLATLQGRPHTAPAEMAWAGPISNDVARRIGCDATVTRILITRDSELAAQHHAGAATGGLVLDDRLKLGEIPDLFAISEKSAGSLIVPESPYWQALPPPLRARALPLDVGRATRTISPALRKALIIRDGGCAMPGCDRPPSWCDAHHLKHWADGGPTCLSNLCLLCQRHHTFVHQNHWELSLNPDGTLNAAPPPQRQ